MQARRAPRRRLASPSTWLGAASALTFAGLMLVVGCTHDTPWTSPYTETPPDQTGLMEVDGRLVDLRAQTAEQAAARNAGCVACHEGATDPHPRGVNMGCVDCHGGNASATTKEEAHPAPNRPEDWPSAANPTAHYNKINGENLDWIRFVNPGDLRVADMACGPCHDQEVLKVHKSVMTTASHFWGVAPYANGITSNKTSIFGESYSPEGVQQAVFTQPPPTQEELDRGVIPFVVPMPHFEVGQNANQFRVFEKGSRLGGAPIAFNGLPTPLIGLPDKLEDPGRPNNRLSDRGLGTLNRVDLTLLNVFKTRLNDPFLSFFGTNDNPGDFRSSGCTACHMVYANDRNPIHSGPYAKYGNRGKGNADEDPWGNPIHADPTIPQDEPGHPISHSFTRAIPTSQCMVCHHHQPNSFVNSYLGFTMWAYDTDGEQLWPEEERDPTIAEMFEVMMRNPEGAAQRGKWGDLAFLQNSSDVNADAKHTQFADYHGHGWMYRGAFKMDRKGNLLDADGNVVEYDSEKFAGSIPKLGTTPSGAEIRDGAFAPKEGKAVHLRDIHAERGMHCVDCHFEQDSHGDGKLYAEYQGQVEITCQDCHGALTVADPDADPLPPYADLLTSGPASGAKRLPDGSLQESTQARRNDLRDPRARTPFGQPRFEAKRAGEDGGVVFTQRSMLYPDLEWEVPQVRDISNPASPSFNSLAQVAHGTTSSRGGLAHGDGKMECYTCHTSWITSCFGCHLPQQANWKTPVNHNEYKELRNYATYNPQVARDAEFMLGIAGDIKGNRIAPVRSSSAVVISSQDAQRRQIYGQVPTIAANGMSSQLFNTHFPHTVRTKETRACDDCHLSDAGDNNAWLAQTYLLGTGTVGLMGYHAYVAEGRNGWSAVRVTEWDEPQAVIGSHLHEMAYPDRYAVHLENDRELQLARHHGASSLPFKGETRSLVFRGEYLYAANGGDGFRVFDVANVGNKDFSLKVVTSPVSPLGQDTHLDTRDATSVALPTNNHISMSRKFRPENKERPYYYEGEPQNMHELYRYAYVTDRYEGLIVVDIDCLTDFDPENNFIRRAATFNPDGILDGAVYACVAGTTVYVCCDRGVVAVDIDDPVRPRVVAEVGAPHVDSPTSISVQFRYAFVTDANGLAVLDVTVPDQVRPVEGAGVEIADARHVYVAKTYAYVSGGAQGLVIVDVERPERPAIDQVFDADGAIDDLYQVKVAMTNDTVFAYLADGKNGLRVLKLVAPNDGGRSAYGFSPRPVPELVAGRRTGGPALAVARALDRDRAVDESGNQVAAFGRIGGRPMDLEEMRRLYLREGVPYYVGSGTASADASSATGDPVAGDGAGEVPLTAGQ